LRHPSPAHKKTDADVASFDGGFGSAYLAHAGYFAQMGEAGHFWISEGNTTHANVFSLKEVSWIDQYFFDHNRGLSVRCLKDAD